MAKTYQTHIYHIICEGNSEEAYLQEEQVCNWHTICVRHNHFISPMNREKVKEEIQQIIPDYAKGSLPKEIPINAEFLKRLYENQKDSNIKFKSDFVDVIKSLLKNAN